MSIVAVHPPKGLTIMMMRRLFPSGGTPSFYNQDWYWDEEFANKPADGTAHQIATEVDDSLRGRGIEAIPPEGLPDAITVVFAFFYTWTNTGRILWPYDYTWCRDRDSNGDPIYIGGYKLNKPGLEIHRHLSLRKCHSVAMEHRGGGDGKVPIL